MTTRTTYQNTEFQKLVKLLDAHLAILDGDEHAFFSQFNGVENLNNVVIYTIDNQVIGCGAIKQFDPKTNEIKRMFVHPNFRGQSIAQKILSELENWAKELKSSHLILETGKNNPAAIALYKKLGYSQAENYAQYKGVESSFCMKKTIK